MYKEKFILYYCLSLIHNILLISLEPEHDKTNKMACAPIEDSD